MASQLFLFEMLNCHSSKFCLEWLTVHNICPDSPMDKTAVSGTTDTGSIPVRGTILKSHQSVAFFTIGDILSLFRQLLW